MSTHHQVKFLFLCTVEVHHLTTDLESGPHYKYSGTLKMQCLVLVPNRDHFMVHRTRETG